MTEAEIKAQWQRYMHRNDLTGDTAAVWIYAGQMITNRLMHSPCDLVAVAATNPQLYLHAGLVYLHELAMDDEGMMREMDRFASDLADYAMNYSLTTEPAPVMKLGGR